MGWCGWFEGLKHKSINDTFVQQGVGVFIFSTQKYNGTFVQKGVGVWIKMYFFCTQIFVKILEKLQKNRPNLTKNLI